MAQTAEEPPAEPPRERAVIRRQTTTPWLLSALEYLLMGLVVFYSATWCLYTAANCNTALRLGVPLMAVLLWLRGERIGAPLWRGAALLAAYLAVYLIATRYNGVRFVLYYATPLLLLLLYTGVSGEGEGLLHKLSDIVLVLSAVSLFFYLFGTALDWLPAPQNATFYWGGSWRSCPTYYHLYYEAQQIRFFGWDMPRNCGVFPEAPGFAVFLVTATATETLLRPRPRLWRCILFAVTTVTTVSAKALLLTAGVFALRYVLWPPEWMTRRVRLWLLPAAGVGLAVAATALLWDKLQSVSGAMRLDDAVACWRAFRSAPLFGTGYWNDASVIPYFSYPDRYNNGLSMGAAVALAQGGLYLSALYWLSPAWCVWRIGDNRRGWAAFALVYAGLLISGNITYHFLTLLFIAVFLTAPRGCLR